MRLNRALGPRPGGDMAGWGDGGEGRTGDDVRLGAVELAGIAAPAARLSHAPLALHARQTRQQKASGAPCKGRQRCEVGGVGHVEGGGGGVGILVSRPSA